MAKNGRFLFFIFRVRNYVSSMIWRICAGPYFAELGTGARLQSPSGIEGIRNISIEEDVVIGFNTFLSARPITDSDVARLEIGAGSRIGKYNHIYATGNIRIGRKVLTASNVYIGDSIHQYSDVGMPVLDQPLGSLNAVEIGEGVWLGHNVVVAGASVGKGSVIGANSVVVKDIPEYSVAVGSPAVVIKRYDHGTHSWVSADKHEADKGRVGE